MSVESGGLTGY